MRPNGAKSSNAAFKCAEIFVRENSSFGDSTWPTVEVYPSRKWLKILHSENSGTKLRKKGKKWNGEKTDKLRNFENCVKAKLQKKKKYIYCFKKKPPKSRKCEKKCKSVKNVKLRKKNVDCENDANWRKKTLFAKRIIPPKITKMRKT